MSSAHVLLVDDEAVAREGLATALRRDGLEVTTADNGEAALALLRQREYEVLLTDVKMPGMDGLELLRRAREAWPGMEVLVVTGFATTESAVEAMRAGAFYYVSKPFRLGEVRKLVREAADKAQLRAENQRLRQLVEHAADERIITRDEGMRAILDIARGVAPTDCNVLIVGETGTGKELLARHVHAHSRRASGPFVAVNCGALNEELLANELFGHEKGAYTGAAQARGGLVEAAQGGTLFLDEVTEMSASMQVKLLRLLQEREYLRVGGTEPVRADVRFLAATNREPRAAVEAGQFRQDIYFRLNVVTLQLPPLRERRDDIPLLAQQFVRRAAQAMGKAVTAIAPPAMQKLCGYDFPGNVRELENIIERGVALAGGTMLGEEDLPPGLGARGGAGARGGSGEVRTLEAVERGHILDVLAGVGGNRALAARLLGIDRVSLWRKLRRYEEQGLIEADETDGALRVRDVSA
ncbi:Acetoacetate metabolism regulatory protein atoC [Methyloversatilis universalis FAM5]|uniref:Acetoacetate metabolism regulatory protein atoC n=1 Tax=Methyloversatilis universalis (strain ATCC BAA-1314 / DSM 25237 / JCM 13912 / CCUG 52030 / FAM5) TaxID=1000565 RepID=F5RBG1_METUF|nr:sigma-54 dependent transcriptional regulator [Methyloversatilis universalis]EGK72132.1 Acetoacetate metabolism regulatory protein atoC [Methyloversatilis universalis FAM5]